MTSNIAMQTNSCAQRATVNTSERALCATVADFVVRFHSIQFIARAFKYSEGNYARQGIGNRAIICLFG